MLFFNIYFLFPMRFCTEIRDERLFLSVFLSDKRTQEGRNYRENNAFM